MHTPAIDVDNRTPTMGKECSAPRKRGQSPESRTLIPPPITGTRSIEVTYSLTSLGADRAGPEELLALVRNHWHTEYRLH